MAVRTRSLELMPWARATRVRRCFDPAARRTLAGLSLLCFIETQRSAT